MMLAKTFKDHPSSPSPSSFIISQITAEGFSPANLAISIAASVCPALDSTPPFLATKGKYVPV